MSNEENTKPEIIHRINEQIMQFPYYPDLATAPGVHSGLNPFYMQMRQEVHNIYSLNLKARRQKMRELYIQDFLRESQELGEVHFGYMNTQP